MNKIWQILERRAPLFKVSIDNIRESLTIGPQTLERENSMHHPLVSVERQSRITPTFTSLLSVFSFLHFPFPPFPFLRFITTVTIYKQ
jgi:hypothetical protein